MNTAAKPPLVADHFSTIEVARLLGMAVRSVQLMVDRGELQAWKTPGGHRRILRESVQEWMRERHAPHKSEAGAPVRNVTQPRVLLIEDSAHYQNLVSLLVKQRFPEVELLVADDGISGLAMAGQLRPQVLIVDILLPGIDGGALITSLRSHAQFSDIQLLVITSLDEDQRGPYAFALEGVAVVHKSRLAIELPDLLQSSLSSATA